MEQLDSIRRLLKDASVGHAPTGVELEGAIKGCYEMQAEIARRDIIETEAANKVEELRAKIDSLQAELDAKTKERDEWQKRWRDLDRETDRKRPWVAMQNDLDEANRLLRLYLKVQEHDYDLIATGSLEEQVRAYLSGQPESKPTPETYDDLPLDYGAPPACPEHFRDVVDQSKPSREERALDDTEQYTVPTCRECGLPHDECKCEAAHD